MESLNSSRFQPCFEWNSMAQKRFTISNPSKTVPETANTATMLTRLRATTDKTSARLGACDFSVCRLRFDR